MIVKLSFLRCWIAEAVTAAGAIGGAALNAISQHRTNAQNRQQAEYAFQQQQQAIQRMNEYNSPAQQVLRMKAAGLNPSLAYGADGALVGNQADVPAYSPIPAEAPSIGNVGAGLADAIRTGIEVRDLERREALAKSEIAAQDYLNFGVVCRANLDNATAQETLTLLGYRVQDLQADINIKGENLNKIREEIANLKASRDEIRSRIGLNEQQVKNLAIEYQMTETQIYAILTKLPHEVAQMDANAAFAWSQQAVGQANVAKINREISHIGFVEWANGRDFDFQKASTVANLEFQRYGYKVDLAKQAMQTIGVITGIAAIKHNQPLPSNQRLPSPVITPSGGSMFGQNWAQ